VHQNAHTTACTMLCNNRRLDELLCLIAWHLPIFSQQHMT